MTSARSSARCFAILAVATFAALLATPQPARAQSDAKMAGDSKMAAEPKMTGNPPALRIRAGSDKDFKDHDGNVWIAEVGFEGGETIDRPDDMKIENTKDPGLYRSEHYSMDSFSLKLPNGKYKVNLHFAETFDGVTEPGGRVFSFKVGDKEFKDFDVCKKAGATQKAYIESVDVDITDGMLKIIFIPNVENPEINAIEIIPAAEKKM
jgi:malectin (di-glucose binding ER protein)